ncbi:hypothetical protein [Bradyrhizobium sp. CCBAU 53338]|uniref:hypothetical protein n=1 Tax=Bradyrhizobium sp. CCBAU 53338 TaxID=1325111 RepID=UPI00188CD77E|nr:hypothetical protein [Bradyrhizobium sp. CCBAU 53338]QOZ52946.1 hypothetical protein XH90_17415 [Bradyrhizobium sp. CCBAU 53338]
MLNNLQNQLPVLDAVGGAQKMAAQYAADYATYLDQGKTSTDAAALASANFAASQAQANSSAKEMLFNLQNQAAAAGAVTGAERIGAQGQATYNSLIHQGVDETLAASVANQQMANSVDAANAKVEQQTENVKDNTAMIRAARDGTEATTAAMIAYKNAVNSGADTDVAIALKNAVLENGLERQADKAYAAAEAYDRLAEAERAAARAAHDAQYADITPGGDNSFGFFQLKNGIEGNSAYAESGYQSYNWQQQGVQSLANSGLLSGSALDQAWSNASKSPDISAVQEAQITQALRNGGIDAAINVAKRFGVDAQQQFQSVDSLYQIKNGMTGDNAVKAANLQDELAWLQSQPETVARDQAIINLQSSIDGLTKSTDSLNSTNQSLLSPYYSQDPRTSHIGFRSQGMATGGEITIPGGYSANDNMTVTVPVASGELLSVRRPGQSLGNATQNVTINLGGITINSGGGQVDTNAIGRTVYQALQSGAKQLSVAGR